MSEEESPSHPPRSGTPTFLELSSADPFSTRKFLETVFGWNFASRAAGTDDGLAFHTLEGLEGRVHRVPREVPPERIGRIRVEDLESTLERAQGAGGTLIVPRVDAPGLGSFFTVRIPGGPILTCWQSASPARPRKP